MMTAPVALVITALFSYLLGAVPFGYLVAKARGVNIFEQGSGNIGATNVGRVLGKKYGYLVFVLDFLKGAIPTLLAGILFSSEKLQLPSTTIPVVAAISAFLGHLFPIYLRFRGGKGVATATGAVMVLLPLPTLAALFTWILMVSCTRYVSLSSMTAATLLCMLQLGGTGFAFDEQHQMLNGFCLLITLLVYVRHVSNLRRLLTGNENRLRETRTMHQVTKLAHVLSMGLWFGMSIFFTFVVAVGLFTDLEETAQEEKRPVWFPLSEEFDKSKFTSGKTEQMRNLMKRANDTPKTAVIRREQGTRASGAIIAPLFDKYFLLQAICGVIAVVTAFSWSWSRFPQKAHKIRSWILLLALISVAVGWWMEMKVSELRKPRNELTEKVLAVENQKPSETDIEKAKEARTTFTNWHLISLFTNFGTILLVTIGMGMASSLPAVPKEENQTTPES